MTEECIRMTSESATKILNDDFVKSHKVTPEEAQVARAIVEQNLLIINRFIDQGYFTEDRLDEIDEDDSLQDKYVYMWDAQEKNDVTTYKQLYDDIKLKPDTFCGWLDYCNELLTETLQLNLMPATEERV